MKALRAKFELCGDRRLPTLVGVLSTVMLVSATGSAKTPKPTPAAAKAGDKSAKAESGKGKADGEIGRAHV